MQLFRCIDWVSGTNDAICGTGGLMFPLVGCGICLVGCGICLVGWVVCPAGCCICGPTFSSCAVCGLCRSDCTDCTFAEAYSCAAKTQELCWVCWFEFLSTANELQNSYKYAAKHATPIRYSGRCTSTRRPSHCSPTCVSVYLLRLCDCV